MLIARGTRNFVGWFIESPGTCAPCCKMRNFLTRRHGKHTMRLSQYPINTMKETPAEAEVISHQLMLRAGLIRRAA